MTTNIEKQRQKELQDLETMRRIKRYESKFRLIENLFQHHSCTFFCIEFSFPSNVLKSYAQIFCWKYSIFLLWLSFINGEGSEVEMTSYMYESEMAGRQKGCTDKTCQN